MLSKLRRTGAALIRALPLLAAVTFAACGDAPSGPDHGGILASRLTPTATPPGSRVRTTGNVNVRATPYTGAAVTGTQPKGAVGTVVGTPWVDPAGVRTTQWQINFDTGADGWLPTYSLDMMSSGPVVTTVTVAPAPATVTIGGTAQLTATVKDQTGAVMSGQTVTWSSSLPANATVSGTGIVTGVAAGTSTISATVAGKTGTAVVTTSRFAIGGRVMTYGAANIRATASVNGAQVGTQPDSALGVVLAGPVVDIGGDGLTRWQIDFDAGPDGWAAEPYLTTSTAPKSAASVLMTPDSAALLEGQTLGFGAVAKDVLGATLPGAAMTWSSGDSTVARVTAGGAVTALVAGTAMIVARSGTVADTALVRVSPVPVAAVLVSPDSAALPPSGTAQLGASTRDSAGATLTGRTVTWSSSNSAVATVSATGLVSAVAAGQANVVASSGGKADTARITVAAPAPVHTGYHVAPNGTAAGDGSASRPWNLATALAGASGRVQPGDTVWIHGGTYTGNFRTTVSGAPGNPIVFRQYPGERAVIDGNGTASGTSVWYVGGSWTVHWGFEITNSSPVRTTSSTANNVRPNVVSNYASNTKYIELVVHDGGVAFYNEAGYSNVEITGCIIYNNGWQGPDRGHGHALYLKSNSGPVVARENVLFNQFGYGVHSYSNAGSGELNNQRLEGNIAFNNGTLSSNSTSSNILLGGAARASGDALIGNFTWSRGTAAGTNVKVGYGTLMNGDVQLQGNYFVGGAPVLEMGFWTLATLSGNTFIGAGGTMVTLNDAARAGKSWNLNTHHASLSGSSWRFGGTGYTFPGWQSITGFSLTDIGLPGTPLTTRVVVRPSPYGSRSNVIVYNWGRLSATMLDLSSVLAAGDRYEVRNVQNLFGAPVATGTYAGETVMLPLTGVPAPIPVGMSSSRAPVTGPDFDVFVVVKL